MSYEIEGKVKVVGEIQTFGSGFQKSEVVITEGDGKYPQDIPIEFAGEKGIGLFNEKGLKVGDGVKISFNLRGSGWKGRYFLSAQAWRCDVLTTSNGQSSGESGQDAPNTGQFADDGSDIDDEIPF